MFYPIALRILRNECVGAKKLATDTFYYFVQGFEFSSDGNSITILSNRIEDTIYRIQDPSRLNITFSAIVGENGSGKSTLVELFMRLINNFATCIFGEISEVVGKPHLHYIDGVNAELYFHGINNDNRTLYKLIVEERHVTLTKYILGIEPNTYILAGESLFDNGEIQSIDAPIRPYKAPIRNLKSKDVLEQFFYTYISNFSIYAYNPDDYPNESTSIEYERKCRRIGSLTPKASECHWLEGMYHRKEAYQIPILLYPSRKNGNIDINLENELAYSRFLCSIISERSHFRKINDHLNVRGFRLDIDYRTYDEKYVKARTGYRKLNVVGYRILRDKIIKEWGKYLDRDLYECAKARHHGDKALNYLCYKTLKISSEYPRLHRYFFVSNQHKQSAFKEDQLNRLGDFINRLAKDQSHITRKIRETLFYLVYGLFDYPTDIGEISVTEISRHCSQILEQIPEYREDIPAIQIHAIGYEDLVPPPFIKTEVTLEDTVTGECVLFSSMSSGEKQFIYSITGVLMILVNLDSVKSNDTTQTASYRNVNLIFEEIELYFHPDLQRRLIQGLIKSLNQANYKQIENINFILVTHSPFILSDIPANNILALDKDGKPVNHKEDIIKSFGANIHDILRHPFFLKDGAVGEFARNFLLELSNELEKLDGTNHKHAELVRLKIGLIDEPIVRKIFMDEYSRKVSVREQVQLIDEQIQMLQAKRETLLGE
jgi:energy-coupling factor transporter ATP-binding protein EcfA2